MASERTIILHWIGYKTDARASIEYTQAETKMLSSFRKKLHALQQRIAITDTEATACLVLIAVIGVGTIIRSFSSRETQIDQEHYATLDAAFTESAQRVIEATPEEAVETEEVRSEQRTRRTPQRLPPVRLDPNTASGALLQRLPGIGPALAGRVIDYRTMHGPFSRPQDLMRVSGIGPRIFERISPYIVIVEMQEEQREESESGSADDELPVPSEG